MKTPTELGFQIDTIMLKHQREDWGADSDAITWSVIVYRKGKQVLTCMYTMGSGHFTKPEHIEKYRNMYKRLHDMIPGTDRFLQVLETKRPSTPWIDPDTARNHLRKMAQTIGVEPKTDEVLASLISEGSAYFDAMRFEDWASDIGYDTDSRKAERMFNECRETGAKLSAVLNREELDSLREWSSEQ